MGQCLISYLDWRTIDSTLPRISPRLSDRSLLYFSLRIVSSVGDPAQELMFPCLFLFFSCLLVLCDHFSCFPCIWRLPSIGSDSGRNILFSLYLSVVCAVCYSYRCNHILFLLCHVCVFCCLCSYSYISWVAFLYGSQMQPHDMRSYIFTSIFLFEREEQWQSWPQRRIDFSERCTRCLLSIWRQEETVHDA